ncbi:hypothetical protein N657DRAFT_638920 [Parathielavia appendiculata]|uniref:Uncharacterized protein n=1 Tax=Parathielavia appendiculata TaxID=2587402 RepID=A0AAN6UBC9_9PEZI|nr:hypothetical protein N657DRAFT_638920 [Parathielavia appendiculata]
MAQSEHNATDIITYIGVPLAVLGVLPILWNTVATLASLSKIKQILRHSKLTALTRSDVVNRVIEVELPRYAVRPMDRYLDRDDYWTLSRNPSSIPGGSWTTFNWRTNIIGHNTQRVEYADQLRQPQVEVAFDDLVCYLLDLGAVPDPQGWRLLRASGLWAPIGSALMRSPDGKEKALTIAPLDGSDGHLSLKVVWTEPWITRDDSYLPPYWVRLHPPPPPRPSPSEEEGEAAEPEEDSKPAEGEEEAAEPAEEDQAQKDISSIQKPSLDSARQQGLSHSTHPITCQISTDGIVTALSQAAEHPQLHQQSTTDLSAPLYIEHIRVRASKSDGAWFASAATAYGTTSQTILWNYKIPDDILTFARKETVPCGVLVLLGVVDESATPEWATRHDDDHGRQLDLFARRSREQRAAMEAEARMPPAQKAAAMRERITREGEQRMQDMRDRLRLEAQRRETRMMEAMQSPKWDTRLVAERNLTWMRKAGEVNDELSLKEVMGTVLHRMVLDGEFSSRLCRMLDLWKVWAENGGMRRSDLAALQEDQITFAYATLLVAIIKDTSTALEGTLSMDLQECLRMWRTVRLG